MRVIFSSRPSYGHLYPMMPLALALREQGHQVIIATSGDFVPRLQALGFAACAVGVTVLWAEEEALRQDPSLGELAQDERARLGVAMFSKILPPATARDLGPLIEEIKPDLIVYEQGEFGAPLAAALAGVPSVFHSWGSPWPPFMVEMMEPNLIELWRSFGIDNPPPNPMYGDAYLDISPPSVGDAYGLNLANRLPIRPVPYSEPIGELPEWLTAERNRPLVYVTLGTVVFERVDVIRAAAAGLAQLDVDVLIAVGPDGDVDALGPLPASVRAQRFVPQDKLLPYLDLIVHHCGSGTMLGGLAYGIPQIAIPQGADQFFNAGKLSQLGAGVALMPHQITPEAITAGAKRLLSESGFKRSAERIEAEIAAMPSPSAVAAALDDLDFERA